MEVPDSKHLQNAELGHGPRDTGTRGKGSRIAFRILALGISAGICFALLELGFRAIETWRFESAGPVWAVYDEELGYRLNPEFGDINAHGLRDHPVRPKGERYRILMLGDSVAYYGDDVDDTFVGHLRRSLPDLESRAAGLPDTPEARAARPASAQEEGGHLDVLNAGVKGYTNYQQMLFLRSHGRALDPDLVGVGFVLNDLFRFLHEFRVEDGRIVGESYSLSQEAIGSVPNPVYRVLRQSHFLVWIRHRLGGWVDDAVEGASEGYSFDLRPDFRTAWLDAPWEQVEEQLAEMVRLGGEDRFGVFLVAFPFAEQYRADYLTRDAAYVLKPQRRLAAICERLEIPFLDLFPLLTAEDFESDLIHLSPDGRRRVGQLVADFLVREKLLPEPAGTPGALLASPMHQAR